MAFNTRQASRARAVVLVIALAIVAALAIFVVAGGFAGAPAGSGDVSAVSAGASDGATSDDDTMESVDAQYGTAAQALLAQLEADPTNPTTLLNVANGYFDWGVAALNHASDDDGRAHANELLNQAVGYYDDYLADNPEAKSAMVDRAICVFYAGDTDAAIASLESLVNETDAGFAPAWANLGMFYESEGRTEEARHAYETAIEAAGDADAYGVRDYAQGRLDALNGAS